MLALRMSPRKPSIESCRSSYSFIAFLISCVVVLSFPYTSSGGRVGKRSGSNRSVFEVGDLVDQQQHLQQQQQQHLDLENEESHVHGEDPDPSLGKCTTVETGRHDFRNWVRSGRVRHIFHDDEFVLKSNKECTGDDVVGDVTVVPLINYTNPFSSSAYINMPPFLGGGTFYVCWKKLTKETGLESPCFARVVQPVSVYSVVGNFSDVPGLGVFAKKVTTIWRAGRRSYFVPGACFLFFVASFVNLAAWINTVRAFLKLKPKDAPKAPDPITVGDPLVVLGESAMKMVSIVFAIVAGVGISTDYIVKSCGGTYTMLVALYPSTFGILAVWRMGIRVGKDQIYYAALRRGKCLGMELHITKWDIALAASCPVLAILILWGMVNSDAESLAYFEMCSPCLVLGVNTVKFLIKEIDHSNAKCEITLDGLAKDIREPDGGEASFTALASIVHTTSSDDKRRASLHNEEASLPGKSQTMVKVLEHEDWKIPEKRFCVACRRGEDPLEDDCILPEETESDDTFGSRDLLWLGNFMHTSTGSRASLLLLPIMCSLMMMLVWSSLECTCRVLVSPELAELQPTEGMLTPNFHPRIKEYSLTFEHQIKALTFFTKLSVPNARHREYRLSGDPLQNTSGAELVSVDLASKNYPQRLTIDLEGYGGGKTWYDIQLVPVTHVLMTIMVEAHGSHGGSAWERCTPFGSMTRVVWPPDSEAGANLTLSIHDFKPNIPLPVEEVREKYSKSMHMVSAYEPVSKEEKAAGETCEKRCFRSFRCLLHEDSQDGCYYGYGPEVHSGGLGCGQLHSFRRDNLKRSSLTNSRSKNAVAETFVYGELCSIPPRKQKKSNSDSQDSQGDAAVGGKGKDSDRDAGGPALTSEAQPNERRLGDEGEDEDDDEEDEANELENGANMQLQAKKSKHCTTVKADDFGYLVFPDVKPLWNGIYFKAVLHLLHRTNTDEETLVSSHNLEFVKGAPLPHKIWAYSPLLKKEFEVVEGSQTQMRLLMPKFVPLDYVGKPWIDIIVAGQVMSRDLFTVGWTAKNTDIIAVPDSNIPCHLPSWSSLAVCKGNRQVTVTGWRLPIYEPQGSLLSLVRSMVQNSQTAHFKPDLESRQLDIVVETENEEEPSQWCIRKTCSLDFVGYPHSATRRWLSINVFAEAAASCKKVNMAYTMQEEVPDSKRYFEFDVTQFVNFGIWMHNGHRETIKLLEAASRNEVAETIFKKLDVVSDRTIVYLPESHALPHDSVALLPIFYHELNYTRLPVELSWDEILQEKGPKESLIALLCKQTLTSTDGSMLMYRAAALHGQEAGEAVNLIKHCSLQRPDVDFKSDIEGTSGLVASIKYGSRHAFQLLAQDPGFFPNSIVSQARKPGIEGFVTERSWADFAVKYGRDFAWSIGLQYAGPIKKLNLAYMGLSVAHLKYVMKQNTTVFRQTQMVDFSHNKIPDEGLQILGEEMSTIQFPELRILNLADIMTASECATPSQMSFLRNYDRLEELVVSDNALCDSDLEPIAELVAKAPHLVKLNLSHNKFDEEGAQMLGDAFSKGSKTIKDLDLSNNNLGEAGKKFKLEALVSLTNLGYSGNGIKDANKVWFSELLEKLGHLQVLDISGNELSNEGLDKILGALESTKSLQELDLSNNPLHGKAATARVATALSSLPDLTVLDISHTGLGLEVVSTRHAKLEKIRLRGMDTGIDSQKLTSALAKLPKLKALLIDMNVLKIQSLAESNDWPKELEVLTMNHCDIAKTPGSIPLLLTLLGKVQWVNRLSLGNNSLGVGSEEELNNLGTELARLSKLERLRLHKNALGPKGLAAITETWVAAIEAQEKKPDSALRLLDLSSNALGQQKSDLLSLLSPLLESHITQQLHSLNLKDNSLNSEDLETFIAAIQAGRILKQLRILRLGSRIDESGVASGKQLTDDELAVVQDRIPWVLVE